MSKRLAAGVLLLAGLSIFLVSLLANVFGQLAFAARLGIGQDPGFGPQQALGTIVGLVGIVTGVWLWRQAEAAQLGAGRLTIAALAFIVVLGVPLFVLAATRLQQIDVEATACVEVEAVPIRAGGTGQQRVDYGVWVTNTGASVVRVDSVTLLAFRDLAASWLDAPNVTAIDDAVVWGQVDSVSVTVGSTMDAGERSRFMRSVIVPVEELSYLYQFRGVVYFGHRGPMYRATDAVWLDSVGQECQLGF